MSNIPQCLLGPLTAHAVMLPYPATVPGVTLYAKFTRFTLPNNVDETTVHCSTSLKHVSLLLASGIGLGSELWIPFIRKMFKIQGTSGSLVRIISIWTLDYANHGDAVAVNERAIVEHYSEIFHAENQEHAVDALIGSYILSEQERVNLVGVAHSGGGGGCFVSAMFHYPKCPFTSIIFVESSFIDRSAKPIFDEMLKAVKMANSVRPIMWASVEEAMGFLMSHFPVKKYHTDVISTMKKTAFRAAYASENRGDLTKRVTTNMSPAQETATYDHSERMVRVWEQLQEKLHALRVHVILGTEKGFWPKPISQAIASGIERNRPKFASVSVVEGAGHFVPQEKPYDLADKVFCALLLDASSGNLIAKL
ncbi:hypothetical protein OF83DRAFT_1178362 [Amylostereum chailletii]|nr:hypothetical protein OF83DRAFT_1178362 [Amylostereum chailletii]